MRPKSAVPACGALSVRPKRRATGLVAAAVLLLWACAQSALAASCTSIASGNWDSQVTWGSAGVGCVGAAGGIPGAGDDVTIAAGTTVNLVSARTARHFTLATAGQLNDSASTLTINGNGNVMINGTWSGAGGGRLIKNGTGNLSGTGSVTGATRIDINGNTSILAGSTFSVAVTNVNARIHIGDGIALTNNGAIWVSRITGETSASALTNATNATLTFYYDLLTTGTLNASASGNVIVYTGGDQTIKLPSGGTYFHLTLAGFGNKTPVAGTYNILGNLAISGPTYAGHVNNPLVNYAGLQFQNNGTFHSGTGRFTFNRTSSQVISGLQLATRFNNLAIDNAHGVFLSQNVIADSLTLLSGKINTHSSYLHIPNGSDIVGANASWYVVGNLRKGVATGTDVVRKFEVGVFWSVLSLVRFGNVTTAGDLTVSAAASDHPSLATSSLNPAKSVNYYWTIATQGVDFAAHANNQIVFNFNAANIDAGAAPGSFYASRYASSTWTEITPAARTASSTTLSGAGMTSANLSGQYAIGERGASAQVFYLYPDHLKTTRAITNEAGATVWKWDNVDPFGANAPDEDPDRDNNKFTFNLRFPGQYFDKETNTHYNYYRDYDPAIGRYVESDPIGLAGGINTYGYALGNPLSWTDPTGELVQVPVALVGLAVITVAAAIQAVRGTTNAINASSSSVTAATQTASTSPSDRAIWWPEKQSGQWVCKARADCNDNIPGNCPDDPNKRFAFGGGTGSTLGDARNIAKANATSNLQCQPKHVSCKCTGPKGEPYSGGC